ncbi:4-fold beta flower protein [Lysinibacillus endophyticus]|uniref:4-fold beta flower protein n=1 Tax=Ureibacillus endophyticus TaxID=1978490 RepID=UPI00209DC0D1|nr:hypothetical protein [Lysinibacillus endophyticus]MCP1145267.1 hypothetical protein [Lysinibacillus endophyticus]
MDYPIWTLSGKFCGKLINNQVYDRKGNHIGYVDDKRIFSARTGKVVGEFYKEDRVGLKTSKSYPVRGIRGIRGSRGFGLRGDKGSISPGGWKDPEF